MTSPSINLTLTLNQVRILDEILRVDLDALGVEKKDQPVVHSIIKKLGRRA